ncbi:MAG: GNAT family N-acetyltransferase [Pseudomonadota bacterium]
MAGLRISEDMDECRYFWENLWPRECLFDLWEVRRCFAEAFNRPHRFHVAEKDGKPMGMLALSWIEEENRFGYFPGETWHGKTWLEQNKFIATSPRVAEELLQSIAGEAQLRYLTHNVRFMTGRGVAQDEVGYLFLPGQYDYCFETYMQSFSGKTRKKLNTELSRLEARGVVFHHDRYSDVDFVFAMNRSVFGSHSYFDDPRFLGAFERLVPWLQDQGLLRVTTVEIGGSLAAVDIGALWKNEYTLLAGATHPDFPGVAKLINFYHMKHACAQRFDAVDFLCGDFNWKERFHLTPRPLYKLEIQGDALSREDFMQTSRVACA